LRGDIGHVLPFVRFLVVVDARDQRRRLEYLVAEACDRGEGGAAGGVRVDVDCDVEAARASVGDDGERAFGRAPRFAAGSFVVRDLDAASGFFADADRLFDRTQQAGALVADVAGVD